MAILGQITLNELLIVTVDQSPVSAGVPAPIGSLALLDDDTNSGMWLKTGGTDTSWTPVPRLVNGTALQNNAILYTDPSGLLKTDTTKMIWEPTQSRLGIGANAPASPQSTIHIDRGTGVGGHVRFTAGTTTGQTSGDGFEIGIDNAGNAEFIQYENSIMSFLTNNSRAATITAGGRLLLGNTVTPIDITGIDTRPIFQIIGTSGADTQMAAIHFSADSIPPVFNLVKSRGATIGAQGLLSADDELGRLQFRGSDGVNMQAGASVRAAVDGTAAAGSMPGRLIFLTTPAGTTTPVERMRIDSTGQSLFASNIRLGNGTDTTNGNLRFDGSEFLARQGGTWRNTAIVPTVLTSGTGSLSTTSATYSTITGLTTTPAAGTYLVFYSVNANITGNSNGDVAIFLAGNEQVETSRSVGVTNSIGTSTTKTSLSSFTVLTVNGSQVVDVRFRENGGGTLSVTSKVFILIPIAR